MLEAAQLYSTALPTKSNSSSGKEDKAVLRRRSGYLFEVKSLRIWESCNHSMQSKELCVLWVRSQGMGSSLCPPAAALPQALQESLLKCFLLLSGHWWPLSHPHHCQGNGVC